MNPKVTVLMPSYNKEEYIAEAIESVLMQEIEFELELAIADDCSNDRTVDIISQYQRNYPEKIKVYCSDKNQGLLRNGLRVLKEMQSQYFCVLDPDDYWIDKNFLRKAVAFLEENREFVCYGSNTYLLENGTINSVFISYQGDSYITNSIEDYFSNQAIVTHTTASVYRNVIFKHGIPELIRKSIGTFSEQSFRGDHDRFIMHLKYGKAFFKNEAVGVYRIHEGGIWSGSSEFHRYLLDTQAKLDYSAFYEHRYEKQFFEMARKFLKIAEQKKSHVSEKPDSKNDLIHFHELKERLDGGTHEVKSYSANSYDSEKLDQLMKVQNEVLWAQIFNSTIRGSQWLSLDTEFSPGRYAIGYPALYILYQTLNYARPTRILELGLGQSTRMIGRYAEYQMNRTDCKHTVVEHDMEWIEFFLSNSDIPSTEIVKLDMIEVDTEYPGAGMTKLNLYSGFLESFKNETFDFIFIDGPIGSDEISRIDILNLIPMGLKNNFVIIMDDYNRIGEQRSISLILAALRESSIEYYTGIYEGEKSTLVITTKKYRFLCSL